MNAEHKAIKNIALLAYKKVSWMRRIDYKNFSFLYRQHERRTFLFNAEVRTLMLKKLGSLNILAYAYMLKYQHIFYKNRQKEECSQELVQIKLINRKSKQKGSSNQKKKDENVKNDLEKVRKLKKIALSK